jgi:aminopeptidase N
MVPKLAIFVLTLAAAAFSQIPAIEPGVSQELAKWRATQYSNVSYKLNLTLEKMSPVLRGSIEIHVTQAAYACAEPNCPPMAIILDWRKIPGHENDSTISNVYLNGVALSVSPLLTRGLEQPDAQARTSVRAEHATPSYEERDDHLTFRDGVRMGENVIKLDFTSPILTSGSAITRYVDKEDGAEYIYSLFVPSDASTAFPVFDQPDLKAYFNLEVDVPKEWTVVSNGTKMFSGAKIIGYSAHDSYQHPPIPADLYRHTFFHTGHPISTYVFAFAAGPFQEFSNPDTHTRTAFADIEKLRQSGGTVEDDLYMQRQDDAKVESSKVYVRKSQAEKFKPHAAEVFRLTREGVKYLETYFDYKFPWPKYDLVLIPEFPFGGMEHAGATFLREQSVIFPQEPTKNDIISRANLIFHETAHQWFGDCVTMKWFDDLWLKEGFAEFMAYKTLEKVMPEANAWKVFYERNKQAAYLTDSTRGTTPIYQPIANLSAAKSAYGNIVYRKAPSFFRQAERYFGEGQFVVDENGFMTARKAVFQNAVRAFLKKYEFRNAEWADLVREFEDAGWTSKTYGNRDLASQEAEARAKIRRWANGWIKNRGLPIIRVNYLGQTTNSRLPNSSIGSVSMNQAPIKRFSITQTNALGEDILWSQEFETCYSGEGRSGILTASLDANEKSSIFTVQSFDDKYPQDWIPKVVFPNCRDYGYGIFLLDRESRNYVLKNIQNEKDDFLRTMMWGSLWDSVREAELDPKDYVELVIKNIKTEPDESTVQTLLGRVSTAMRYYLADRDASAAGQKRAQNSTNRPPVYAGGADLNTRFEAVLLDRLQHAPAAGQRITYYRAFVQNASTPKGREVLKQMLAAGSGPAPLRAKDKFDIVTRLIILGDPEARKLLVDLEKTETSDDAKRYAYAARAGFATPESKARYFSDFLANKDISESWIEAAMGPFNSIRHADLTQPYLERALAELPNLKRNRKIFFVNGWLGAFIGGQKSEAALAIVNKFLSANPNLDRDLRLKVLENIDLIERAVKIRSKYGKN